MYSILLSSHSGIRWISLIALLLSILIYFVKLIKGSSYTSSDKKILSITVLIFHIQFLVGFILYFVSPKVLFSADAMASKVLRFFTVEHAVMMLAAVVILTIGSAKVKRKEMDAEKFKTGFIFLVISLLIVLLAIPWPFQELGAGWF